MSAAAAASSSSTSGSAAAAAASSSSTSGSAAAAASTTNNGHCFNEGTLILCEGDIYVAIQDLRVGDLVKTLDGSYKKIGGIGKNMLVNNPLVWTNCMYKMNKTNSMIDDLMVTGKHSVLVDELTQEQMDTYVRLGVDNEIGFEISGKKLLFAGVSEDFQPMMDTDTYTYYHFYLESNNEEERFGVWANGVLTETTCKNHFERANFTPL